MFVLMINLHVCTLIVIPKHLAYCIDTAKTAAVTTPVAFHAVKTSPQRLADGDVVTFDVLDVNLADGFNLTSSSFSCPVTGMYHFYFSLSNNGASDGRLGSATLVMDDTNEVNTYHRRHVIDVVLTQSFNT